MSFSSGLCGNRSEQTCEGSSRAQEARKKRFKNEMKSSAEPGRSDPRLGEGRIEDQELRSRVPIIRRGDGRQEVWLLGRGAQCRMEFHPQPASFEAVASYIPPCAHPELLLEVKSGVSRRRLGI